ncbi:MAG: PilZ domain-containing protein [Candidatus Omnitrophica bacterium]|nr:PilZ domain-containing protein [Candidatus Omnitrophota bacterium]
MSQSKSERRDHPRATANLGLKIRNKGLYLITDTRNISCSGVYCRVNKPLPLMSKISLTLLIPIRNKDKINTVKIRCNGVVVRSEPEILEDADTAYQNIAIFFTDLPKKDRSNIAQYVLQSFEQELL